MIALWLWGWAWAAPVVPVDGDVVPVDDVSEAVEAEPSNAEVPEDGVPDVEEPAIDSGAEDEPAAPTPVEVKLLPMPVMLPKSVPLPEPTPAEAPTPVDDVANESVEEGALDTDPEMIPLESIASEQEAPAAVVPSVTPAQGVPPMLAEPEAVATPSVRPRGFGVAIGWSMLVAVMVALSYGLGRVRRGLGRRGLLPWLTTGLRAAARLGVFGAATMAVVAVLPLAWMPYVPFGLGVAALVMGWALRDVVRDLGAGVLIVAEGKVRSGHVVTTDHVTGVVERVGLRVTWVRDEHGARTAVPNRKLLEGDVTVAEGPYPVVVVELTVPWEGGHDLIRERLHEAALISPWRAPAGRPEVRRGVDRGAWSVSVPVLELRFAERHREMVREVVWEALELERLD